jgi:hypothetical protein
MAKQQNATTLFAADTQSYNIYMLFDNAEDAVEYIRLQTICRWARKDGYGAKARFALLEPTDDTVKRASIEPVHIEQIDEVARDVETKEEGKE